MDQERLEIGCARDAADIQAAEQALRISEERHRSLLNTMSEGFCIVEMLFDAEQRPVDYRIVESNPAFETQTGLRNAQGRLMSELVPGHEALWAGRLGAVVLTGASACFLDEANALGRCFEVSAYRIEGPGSREAAIMINDVTERKRIEDALREGGVQLSDALQEIQAADAALKAQNEELRRAEDALRGSRDFLDSIINAVADPVYVKDTRHRYVLINDAFVESLGFARDEIVGRTSADFFFSRAAALFSEQEDRVLATGKRDVVEVQVQDGTGRERIVSAIKTRYTDAAGEPLVVGCLRDVTEARTSEQVALRARAEWERTFNTVPDLIVVLDEQHRIRRANKALAGRLGVTPESLTGRPSSEAIHGAADSEVACLRPGACADGKEHFVEFHEDRLGGDFLVSTSPVFDENGQVTGCVHVGRDITESKKTEAKLREAAKLRDDLMSLINHEYANGLTNLKLAAALLRGTESGDLDETKAHSYEVLERTVEKLKSYTANFLNLHRMDLGDFELALQPVAVRAVLLKELTTLRLLAEAKRQCLTLQASFPEDMPVAVQADPDCLSLVVNNLVSNAVKYTPEGGRITVCLSLEDGPPARVCFSIEDTGMGLTQRDRERILSGSYRTDEGRQAARGFGVGLVLVRQFLQKHGSHLEIASEHGKGSRFSFCLPVWSEAPAAQPA